MSRYRSSISRRLFLAALAQAALSGCSRPSETGDDGVQISVNVTPRPPVTGTARVEIVLRDAGGRPLEATAVKLEGNMSHAGMKPSVATVRRSTQGSWVADLELTMGGDWLLLVQAVLADGREIERTVPLRGVGAR